MNATRFLAALFLGLWSLAGNAADLALKDQDCAKILERWAEDPDSVPKRLVDACKEQVAAAAPAPAMAAAPAEAVDPCAGPGAAGSVECWGPWSALAPAAAGPVAALEIPDERGDCVSGSSISDQCVPRLVPLAAEPGPPLEGCAPGLPCGFATLVDGLTSNGDVEDTQFKKFNLASDGSQFTVDPGGDDEVDSPEMSTNIAPRDDGYGNLTASNDRQADERSALKARVVQDDESGDIIQAADVWTRGVRSDGTRNKSGYFAWGIATSQSGLALLNGEGVSVSFTGPMSVNNATNASVTVNFGSQPTWNGGWQNTRDGWSFGAGGSVSGVNLLSSAGQFTSNVNPDISFVQGALVGEPGRQGITHIIDVTLADKGRIKDVGLLRQSGIDGPSVDTGLAP